jgi:hypothetical protein
MQLILFFVENQTSLCCKKKHCNYGIVISPVFSANPAPHSKVKTRDLKLLKDGLVLVMKVDQ